MANWSWSNEFGYFAIELVGDQLLYTVSSTALGEREIGASNRDREPVTLAWLRESHEVLQATLDEVERAMKEAPAVDR